MRFIATTVTLLTLIFTSAPVSGAFLSPFAQNQNLSSNRPAPIPAEARRVRRPYASQLNPSRPLRTPATPAPRPNCAAVCVIDPYNGNVLYGYNANTRRQVASTQKIITALCVCDTKDLDKVVTIKASDRLAPPIRLNLRAGEQYTRRDLLQAMLTGSFNDVAVSLARDCAGSVDAFVDRMNARAKRMRMYNTHFKNPNGLPAQQYSTAYDMALAACYAYNNRTIRSMINIPAYEFRRNNGSVRIIRSTNRLIYTHPWVHGMKTGYTNLAGKCLISCGSSNGRAVIVVVLGSTSRKIWGESLKYLRWALGDV
ncbi:MAG: D-alanyl-D-alanine carboxypeptidase [Akkermansiaceae bacterium]|nr:D-alanyl-D-alanine carboxypeptidase [Akkermansiaceae bacterium]